jgi:hypothetical protein
MKREQQNAVRFLLDEVLEEGVCLGAGLVSLRHSHFEDHERASRKLGQKKSRRPCPTGKQKYKDKREADRVKHLINSKAARSQMPQAQEEYSLKRSYKCSCGYWHHTSYQDMYRVGA